MSMRPSLPPPTLHAKAFKWSASTLAQVIIGQVVAVKWPLILTILAAAATTIGGLLRGLSYTHGVLLGLGVGLGVSVIALLLAMRGAVKHRSAALNANGASVFTCPDTWLHKLAETQRQNIDGWVTVATVDWHNADIFRDRRYLQFEFTVHNGSVFYTKLGNPTGLFTYANEPVIGSLEWVPDSPEMPPCSVEHPRILRLFLEDKNDRERILNTDSWFSFANLNIPIEGEKHQIDPKPLRISTELSVGWLTDKYPNCK